MFNPFLDMTNAKSEGIASVGHTLNQSFKPAAKLASMFALRTCIWWLTAVVVAFVFSWDISHQDMLNFAMVIAAVITIEDLIKAARTKGARKRRFGRL